MRKNQFERFLVRRPCIKYLREQINLNQLKRWPFLYWTCPPDHGKMTGKQAGEMKLDGYEKGCFDLTIICADNDNVHIYLIEFKYGKNDYTDEQKEIAIATLATPIEAIKIYSIDEFMEFVTGELK